MGESNKNLSNGKPLEGIEVDIKIAKVINSVSETSWKDNPRITQAKNSLQWKFHREIQNISHTNIIDSKKELGGCPLQSPVMFGSLIFLLSLLKKIYQLLSAGKH